MIPFKLLLLVSSNFSYAVDSYKKINIIFTFMILLVFLYCFFFPYLTITLTSSCEGMPAAYCRSRGLTRAFSEILRLNFAEALQFNSNSIQVFSFFFIQLFARITVNKVLRLNNFKKIVYVDSILSAVFFIFSFYKLLIIT